MSCSQSPSQDIHFSDLFVRHKIEGQYPFGHISSQAVGDFDGDGYLDIVIRSGKSGKAEIAWYRNPLGERKSGKKVWKKYQIGTELYPSGSRSSGCGLLVHDINNDGRSDIVTGAKVEGIGNGLFWWESPLNPMEGKWHRFLIKAPNQTNKEEYAPHDLILADVNMDGKSDIVIGGSSNQGVYWTVIPKEPRDASNWKLFMVGKARGLAYAGLAVGDIDGDRRPDIIRSDVWYQATGPVDKPHWKPHLYGLINTPPSNIALKDIDHNGKLDIVVSSGHNFRNGHVDPPFRES